MLAPTFLFVGVITMIGYFQLFAEPYVMTRGGPLNATLSMALFMYQQGFRWWNMGYSAAIAFVLFLLILAATLLQLRPAAEGARVRRSGRARRKAPSSLSTLALVAGAALTLVPLLWMISASFMPAGPGELGAARSPPAPPTLEHYRTLFTRIERRADFGNSLVLALAVTSGSLLFNSMAGYAFAKLRFAGPRSDLRVPDRRARDSRAGRDAAALPDHQEPRASSTRCGA